MRRPTQIGLTCCVPDSTGPAGDEHEGVGRFFQNAGILSNFSIVVRKHAVKNCGLPDERTAAAQRTGLAYRSVKARTFLTFCQRSKTNPPVCAIEQGKTALSVTNPGRNSRQRTLSAINNVDFRR